MYFLKSLLAVLRFYDLGDKKRRMTQKVKKGSSSLLRGCIKRAFLVSLAILLKYQLSELLGTVKTGLFPFNRIP